MAAEFVGTSGTLVGAALETAGLYYQSLLLDSLTNPFRSSIGALIYVVGGIIALVSFTLTGKFKLWKWFLIGPWLFFFAIGSRVETTGTAWHFGDEARDEARRQQEVDKLKDNPAIEAAGPDKLPQVSQLFAGYNRLVSKSVAGMVNVLKGSQKNLDAKFKVRIELYAGLMSRNVQDSNFREFLHLTMKRKCGAMVETYQSWKNEVDYFLATGRAVPNPSETAFYAAMASGNETGLSEADKERLSNLSPEERKRLLDFVERARKAGDAQVELKDGAWNYFVAIAAMLPQIVNKDTVGPKATRRGTFWSDVSSISGGKTMLETYLLAVDDAAKNPADVARRFQCTKAQLEGRDAPADANCGTLGEKWLESPKLSCLDVWNLTSLGLYIDARAAVVEAKEHGKRRGIPETDILQSLVYAMLGPRDGKDTFVKNDPAVTGEALDRLEKAIATYTLRNEMNRGSQAAFIGEYKSRGKAVRQLEIVTEDDLAFQENQRQTVAEGAERTRLLVSATNLPYYQGIGLYFLAAVFPLFCLLLLIPGKHEGFLLWFFLWLWIKSWDIGFAVVMLLDSTLFSIISLAGRKDGVGKALTDDPNVLSLLTSFNRIDSTFQLSMYYAIVATALSSIPVISSYIILGIVKKGGSGLLAEGMSALADFPAMGVSRNTGMTSGLKEDRIPVLEMKVDYGRRAAEAYLKGENYSDPLVDVGQSAEHAALADPTGRGGSRAIAGNAETSRWTGNSQYMMESSQGVGRPNGLNTDRIFAKLGVAGSGKRNGDARVLAAKRAAQAQGLASGMGQKFLPTAFDPARARWKGFNRAAAGIDLLQDRLPAAEEYAKAVRDAQLSIRTADLDVAIKFSGFDCLNSDLAQEHNRIAIWKKFIPLPWVEEGSPYEKYFGAQMNAFTQNMKLNSAAIKSLNKGLWGKEGPPKPTGPWQKKENKDYKTAVWNLAYATVLWQGVGMVNDQIIKESKKRELNWRLNPETGEWEEQDLLSEEGQQWLAQEKFLGHDPTKPEVPDRPDGTPGEGSIRNIKIVPTRTAEKIE